MVHFDMKLGGASTTSLKTLKSATPEGLILESFTSTSRGLILVYGMRYHRGLNVQRHLDVPGSHVLQDLSPKSTLRVRTSRTVEWGKNLR